MTGVFRYLSPISHLAVTVLWLLPVFLSFDPYTPLLFLALCLLYLLVPGRVALARLFSTVGPLMALPAGLFMLNLLFTDTAGHPAAVAFLWFSVNRYALHRALILGLRSAGLITISVGYLLATDPLELVNALMQQLRLPARVGFSIFVAWNTIPRLSADYQRIRVTHRIRYRGRKRQFRELVPTAVTLLTGAVRHAQRAAISMGVRGIEESTERTYLHRTPWRARDTAYLAVSAVLTAALFGFSILNGWFVFGLG